MKLTKYCSCVIKNPGWQGEKKKLCISCNKPIHPGYGKSQTSLQCLAAQRNWARLRANNAINTLLSLSYQYNCPGIFPTARSAELYLLNKIDEHWNTEKQKEIARKQSITSGDSTK